ncbi:signal peptide protein [Pontibacillus halophilus JSM 076056 = DSM 19796]|uniref:Signal peptide protein n=1 Tax=Pontibacillus halophilus JSM 076056 = DSM 19796 TaxID=1385510 RepID=A0A0A5GH23_9BACI|nr:signal peptide peptidase SppA [Pontibacillus halophilus]KGX91334.1 signal peptide protein [Pontibacillus halophilus JSM 076056 = DSM 19796]
MNKRIIAVAIAGALLIIAGLSEALSATRSSGGIADTSREMLAGNMASQEKIIEQGSANSRIARIEVDGAITSGQGTSPLGSVGYNHDKFLEKLEQIQEDDTIKGVLLYVNSPGGGVFESAQIHDKLQEMKEDGKKLYVSMGGMAASGGYYISAPADVIYASNETLTGSLGVIMQSINYKELANEYGIKFNTIKSGEFKDIMSPAKEMSDEDRAILQELVDESYQGFVDVISEGRGMSEEQVREIADGRIYSGQQAMDNGLVDEIGFEEDALNALKKAIGGNPQVVEYKTNGGSLFGFPLDIQSFLPNSDVKWIEQLIQQRQGPTLMYMYAE